LNDEIVVKKPGAVSYLGGGCGCFGALMLIGGVATLVGIPTGAYNGSVVTQAAIGGGTGTCVGLLVFVVGMAGWFMGKKKVVI